VPARLAGDLARLKTCIEEARAAAEQVVQACKEITGGGYPPASLTTLETVFLHHCHAAELLRRQVARDYLGGTHDFHGGAQ